MTILKQEVDRFAWDVLKINAGNHDVGVCNSSCVEWNGLNLFLNEITDKSHNRSWLEIQKTYLNEHYVNISSLIRLARRKKSDFVVFFSTGP
jgi:hypothetical protein